MRLYYVRTHHESWGWTSEKENAIDRFYTEIDFITGEGTIDEDAIVELFEIKLEDFCKEYDKNYGLYIQLDEKAKVIKRVIWVVDEEKNPRDDGHDFDFYVNPIEVKVEDY